MCEGSRVYPDGSAVQRFDKIDCWRAFRADGKSVCNAKGETIYFDSFEAAEAALRAGDQGPADKAVRIIYRNHRGEVSERLIRPDHIRFGSTEFHPGPGWLLEAYDFGKAAGRSFAMEDIIEWRPAT